MLGRKFSSARDIVQVTTAVGSQAEVLGEVRSGLMALSFGPPISKRIADLKSQGVATTLELMEEIGWLVPDTIVPPDAV